MSDLQKVKRRPKAIDLFCGAGGMSLGFEQAGFDIVYAIDSDGHHVAAHRRNFPLHQTVCGSVAELTGKAILEAIAGEEIDLVFGGPPCQGFSSMGLRDELDPRNSLVNHFARLVTEIRPKAFVMENVPGMANGKTKDILNCAISTLESAGYLIAKPVKVLDASQFGVPQKRKRLFLLGIRSDFGIRPSYPAGPPAGQPLRPTVWEAIGDLPDVDKRDYLFESDSTDYDRAPTSDYAKVARSVERDPSDFSYRRRWSGATCTGCMRIRHTEKAIDLYETTPIGRTVPGHKLPKLDPEGICSTLRAGSDSTHGSYTAPRPIHPNCPRCITAREAARLHGFPDWFTFYPTKWHAYRQIGNAVCPPVARAVGLSIMKALGYAPYRPGYQIVMPDGFNLPNERPRSLRRIPFANNYPPVIGYLFAKAFDAKEKRLRRTKFTFDDVREAIISTGVNLPWTRADTFVQEIARSRGVRQILEPCLSQGYSLAPSKGRFIGEFLAADDPRTITEKDTIEIRSGDMSGAVIVNTDEPLDFERPQSLSGLFRQRIVLETIWHKGISFQLSSTSFNGPHDRVGEYNVSDRGGVSVAGIIAIQSHGRQPTKSRVQRIVESHQRSEVLVLVPLTREHVVALRYKCAEGQLREIRRSVFRIPRARHPKPGRGSSDVTATKGNSLPW